VDRVAVVDHGLGNLDSVRRAVEEVGGRPYLVGSGDELGEPDHIVLPGVGAFPDGMRNLHDRKLVDALEGEVLGSGVPLLAICLGMHLLASTGREGGETAGLGWIPGTVQRLEATPQDHRVPHVGWNEVHPRPGTTGGDLFASVPADSDFYFVHSYHFVPDDPSDSVATTPYCGGFTSVVNRGNVWGVQFHPEKSQRAGFAVLRAFLEV
jgi:imidazole glycerol-phosphate synthase subunit HisH